MDAVCEILYQIQLRYIGIYCILDILKSKTLLKCCEIFLNIPTLTFIYSIDIFWLQRQKGDFNAENRQLFCWMLKVMNVLTKSWVGTTVVVRVPLENNVNQLGFFTNTSYKLF